MDNPSLARMWEIAERSAGKRLKDAIAELNTATGRRYCYKSHVWQWIAGKKPVPHAARAHMLHVALPTIMKCVGIKLGEVRHDKLEEMLR